MPKPWLDFAAIKKEVPIRDVLAGYGFLNDLKERKPGRLVGPCPIHHGTGKASFHVDCDKNIWNCFSVCKSGGNVLDLVMKIEDCSVREAGELLAERYLSGTSKAQNSAKVSEKRKVVETADAAGVAHDERAVEVINPPLERPLKNLDPKHPYLTKRLAHETAAYFGCGFCSGGMMRGRIAIPIHNEDGVLVAYAGRAVDEELARENGKYRFPSNNFRKSALLFNLHRAKDHAQSGLLVVEGFFGAMRVHEAGVPNIGVVAIMGSTMSEEQERLLLAHTNRVMLMFDGDDAGRACLQDCYERLKRKIYLKEIHLEDGEEPDMLTADRIRELLS